MEGLCPISDVPSVGISAFHSAGQVKAIVLSHNTFIVIELATLLGFVRV